LIILVGARRPYMDTNENEQEEIKHYRTKGSGIK
jgi:hypothetical protein